jgi:hypothetical protein
MKASSAVAVRSIEKRRHRRRKVWLPAIIRVDECAGAAAWIRDLSCKGARIETEAQLSAGGKVTLLRKGIETGAIVAWVRGQHVGLTFVQPFAEKDLVEYSLPRAPLSQMMKVHGRPSERG